MEDKLLYRQESFLIRGACFEVYKEFGGAFKESVVDKALQIALKERKLKIESQKRIDIYFKEIKIGTYVPDIVVNSQIIIELKNKPFLTKGDIDQFWKYLKGTILDLNMRSELIKNTITKVNQI